MIQRNKVTCSVSYKHKMIRDHLILPHLYKDSWEENPGDAKMLLVEDHL